MTDTESIEWTKKGRIFVPSGKGFLKTHAARPVPYRLNQEIVRIFFSSRDDDDRMLPTFLDVEAGNPSNIIGVSTEPLINIGEPGTFDDSGITLGSISEDDGEVFIYYTGWKRRRIVSFELSIGLLRWDRKTDVFERVFAGPILGQDRHHPYLAAGPYVMKEGGVYRMWYCSGTGWEFPSNNPEPIYTVFYAESGNGIDWTPHEGPVIPYNYDGEVVSAPWVLKVKHKYCMWYSTRGHTSRDAKNYTIGYAESADGLSWERMDELAGIPRSMEGWDSEMTCYPAFLEHGDNVYMFYSGNGVGRWGMGYAVAENFLSAC